MTLLMDEYDEYFDRLKARAKEQGRTVSELLFEAFCQQSKIRCDRIEAEEIAKGMLPKAPDYEILIDDRRIIVEVKELTQNEEETEAEKHYEKCGHSSVLENTPGDRVRKKIQKSSQQIQKRTLGRHPGILVLYGRDRMVGHHLRLYDIMVAMYGLEEMTIAAPADYSSRPYLTGTRFGPCRKMNPDDNTSISAIAVLAVTPPTGFQLDVFHNLWAAIPIDPALLARGGIAQYRLDIEARSWVRTP